MNPKVMLYSLAILVCLALIATTSRNSNGFTPGTSKASTIGASIGQSVDTDDMSPDQKLKDNKTTLSRGPYIQMTTPKSAMIKWRTSSKARGYLRYGRDPANLNKRVNAPTRATENAIRLSGLSPDTKYYYEIGVAGETLVSGGKDYFFSTAPGAGKEKTTRVWIIGDSGIKGPSAEAVRDSYLNFVPPGSTDIWLMLGDNAYDQGTDSEYQNAVFDMYPMLLRNTAVWPVLGNHDTDPNVYSDIFSLPTRAEAGGTRSDTEAYYSYDYGDIHFVALNSTSNDNDYDTMLSWLEDDLARTKQKWIIAYLHHSPYSKGSHDSDEDPTMTAVRTRVLPILENGGVDLVLSGHSHSYERSYLIDGHYGLSETFNDDMLVDGGDGRREGNGAYRKTSRKSKSHQGAVYVVAGTSSSVLTSPFQHSVMNETQNALGSLALEISGDRLDARFIDDQSQIRDSFTIIKQ